MLRKPKDDPQVVKFWEKFALLTESDFLKSFSVNNITTTVEGSDLFFSGSMIGC